MKIFQIIDKVVLSLQPTEKDIIAFLFFGGMFLTAVIMWVFDDLHQWYKSREEYHKIDREYVLKLMLLPVLTVVLLANGAEKKERQRRISDFMYA